MSVFSGLLQGINEGIEKQRQEKNKRADIEAENAKARGMEILKGIIGGDIEETQDPQEAVLTQPGEVIKRGLFGKAETAPGRMYKSRIVPKEWKPTTKEEALELEKEKANIKTGTMSPSVRKQRIKDTSELTNISSRNKNTRQYINEAIGAIDKIPQGAGGLIRRKGMEWFDPKNPILGEWQKIKSVLSDIQLGKLQFTKGAISDREMEFFSNAVANNNIASAPRIKLILNRALNELDTDEEAKKKAYTLNYEEDPEEIFGQQAQFKKGSIKSKYADLGLE